MRGIIVKEQRVSIAEGKKYFSRLIKDSIERQERIIITCRGEPVAILLPYNLFIRNQKKEAYEKIIAARARYHQTNLKADEIFEASRTELEGRS